MNSGDKIKALRLARGLTLEEVGKFVGVGKSTVRKWETGAIANMRRDKIAKLAEVLGTTPADILGIYEEDPAPVVMQQQLFAHSVSLEEEQLLLDYRDASAEIREEAAGMLHRSAERNRKDARSSPSAV